jgi:hypothetical protein
MIPMILRLILLALIPLVSMFPIAPHAGQTACPSSGTQIAARGLANLYSYVLSGDQANTGYICFGDATVNTTTKCGYPLFPLSAYTTPSVNSPAYNLANVYFACSVSADKLDWNYQQ